MEKVKIVRINKLVYNDIFKDELDNMLKLLKSIPMLPALEFITYILHLFNIRKRNEIHFQRTHLNMWLMHLDRVTQALLLEYLRYNRVEMEFISRRPCLKLVQHILVYADRDNSRSLAKENYSALFKLLLCFNAEEVEFQKDIFNYDESVSNENFLNSVLQVQMRNIENERFKNYVIQFLKINYFFKFCELDPQYKNYLDKFLKKLNINNYKTYLFNLISPLQNLILNKTPTPKMHISDGNILNFFKNISVNNHVSLDEDYSALRSYPLYQVDANHFLFLDFRFFVDKLYTGFLFDFSKCIGIGFDKLKQEMGQKFSEVELFYSIMRYCFPKYGDVILSGTMLKKNKISAEPDYYIRKGNNILIFEFKDLTIPKKMKYASDIEEIKNGIIERLEDDGKGNRKGISQLLNSAKMILNGAYRNIDIKSFSKNIKIHPILVHTDISLESHGVNYFLNERLLQLVQKTGISGESIENITVIHLETLIQLQDYFHDGDLDLLECIIEFQNYTSSGDPVNDTLPFDEFVKYYLAQVVKKDPHKFPRMYIEIVSDFS